VAIQELIPEQYSRYNETGKNEKIELREAKTESEHVKTLIADVQIRSDGVIQPHEEKAAKHNQFTNHKQGMPRQSFNAASPCYN